METEYFWVWVGVLGLLISFTCLAVIAKRGKGVSTGQLALIALFFGISTFITVIGDKVKVISTISSGATDDK